MKQKFLLTFLVLMTFMALKTNVVAVVYDTIPYKNLIISEVNTHNGTDWLRWSYYELTNVGDSTIDLGRFFLQGRYGNGDFAAIANMNDNRKVSLSGTLKPGEVYLIALPAPNQTTTPDGKQLIYPNGYCIPEILGLSDRVLRAQWNYSPGGSIGVQSGVILVCRLGATDSVIVDLWGDDNKLYPTPDSNPRPIAGVTNPIEEYVFVRKINVKEGNAGDWDMSRGTDISDSEWLPIPKYMLRNYRQKLFTTVGIHESVKYSFTPKSSEIVIDSIGKKISVPYGTRRDSFIYYFNVGKNIGYLYTWGNDSTDFFCRSDDKFSVYFANDSTLKTVDFALDVKPKSVSFTNVSPLQYKNENLAWTSRYEVSITNPVIDTISEIPYGTRIDTLLNYLVFDESATKTITFVDGIERPDLKLGDKLVIKSGSDTKEYYLKVDEYIPNYNPSLSAIVLPGSGLFMNANFDVTDTIPNFSSTSYSYFVKLPMDTKTPPAIVGVPVNNRSSVIVKKPKNIFGTQADRTAKIIVRTEADSIWEYDVLFEVERELPPIKGEPFFTVLGEGGWGSSFNYQIINPSSENLDLSDYIVFSGIASNTGLQSVIKTAHPATQNTDPNEDWRARNKQIMRFGYVFNYDVNNPAKSKSVSDIVQKTTVLPPFGYYWLSGIRGYPKQNASDPKLVDQIDIWHHWGKIGSGEPWANLWGTNYTPLNINLAWDFKQFNITLGLAKIVNDSVRNGEKGIVDAKDFEIVEVFNKWNGLNGTTGYQLVTGTDTVKLNVKGANIWMARKNNVYTGNPIPGASFGSSFYPSEWKKVTVNDLRAQFKNFTITSKAYVSYLESSRYLISKGLTESETIIGVVSGTTIDDFIGNVVIADTGMVLQFFNGETEVTDKSTALLDGNKVKVTSADGNNSVTYIITVGSALDSNTALSSTTFNVTLPGSGSKWGKIANVDFGTTITQLVDGVTAPATATMTITNIYNEVIPAMAYNNDTNLIKAATMVDVIATNMVVLEVVAQNGVDTAFYAVEIKQADNIAKVTSNVYFVNEDAKNIQYVPATSVDYFLSNLIPTPGATMKVINKMGQQRTDGFLGYDDKLVVTSKDGSVSVEYWIGFMNEMVFDNIKENAQRTVSLYPNPVREMLTVETLQLVSKIQVFNLNGKLIRQIVPTSTVTNISVNNIDNGMYVVKIVNRDNTFTTQKFVKL